MTQKIKNYYMEDFVEFVRNLYNSTDEFIPLHAPVFVGNEKKYLNDRIFFKSTNTAFFQEPEGAISNYWLNAIILNNLNECNAFFKFTNDKGIMTRPIWKLMSNLKMFENYQKTDLSNAMWLEERVVNIPNGVVL